MIFRTNDDGSYRNEYVISLDACNFWILIKMNETQRRWTRRFSNFSAFFFLSSALTSHHLNVPFYRMKNVNNIPVIRQHDTMWKNPEKNINNKIVTLRVTSLAAFTDTVVQKNVGIYECTATPVRSYIRRGHTTCTKFERKIRATNRITKKWLHQWTWAMRYDQNWTKYRCKGFWCSNAIRIATQVSIFWQKSVETLTQNVCISFNLFSFRKFVDIFKCMKVDTGFFTNSSSFFFANFSSDGHSTLYRIGKADERFSFPSFSAFGMTNEKLKINRRAIHDTHTQLCIDAVVSNLYYEWMNESRMNVNTFEVCWQLKCAIPATAAIFTIHWL